MTSVHLKLFGDLQVHVGGTELKIRGHNEQRLLALLALKGGRQTLRRDLAEELWPEVDFPVSGNRLRTTLAGLRRPFGSVPIVLAVEQSLMLNKEAVTTDIEEAAHLDRKRQFAGSVDEEAATLDRLLSVIARDLLEGWEEPWVQVAQSKWVQVRLRTRVRLSELALLAEDHDRAIEHSEAAIEALPFDEGAWGVYLAAMAKTGAGEEAARRFRVASKQAQKSPAGSFSPQLAALAGSVRDGLFDAAADWPQLPAGVDSALLRGLLRLIQVEPVLAAHFITSDAFRLEMLRVPSPSIKFIESLLKRLPEASPERTAVETMALRIHSVLHDVDEVIAYGRTLLEKELDPVQLRLVLSQMSFAYFLVRDMNAAMDLIGRALQVAEQHASPHHYQLTRADRALYLWHEGHDEEAQAIFEEVFGAVKDLPATQVSYAPAYLSGLIGTICLWRGETRAAEQWLLKGYSAARARRYVEQLHQIEPPLGLARARQGDVHKGGPLVISGLAHFSRSGNIRAFASALDAMAEVFTLIDHPSHAAQCLHWGSRLRERAHHGRSVAEIAFAARVGANLQGVQLPEDAPSGENPSQVLEWIVQHFYQE